MNHAIERIAEESARTQAERAHLNSMRRYAESSAGKIWGVHLTPEGRKLVRTEGGVPQWPMPKTGNHGALAVILGTAARDDRLAMERWQRKQGQLKDFHEKSILLTTKQDYWWDKFLAETDNQRMLLTYRLYRYVDQGLGYWPEQVAYAFSMDYFGILRETEGAIDYPLYEFARNLETAKLSIKQAARRLKGAKESKYKRWTGDDHGQSDQHETTHPPSHHY